MENIWEYYGMEKWKSGKYMRILWNEKVKKWKIYKNIIESKCEIVENIWEYYGIRKWKSRKCMRILYD